ncbi:hypothetical protein VTH06DRAFT_3642 [Thermothelomyces fergusii]
MSKRVLHKNIFCKPSMLRAKHSIVKLLLGQLPDSKNQVMIKSGEFLFWIPFAPPHRQSRQRMQNSNLDVSRNP